MAPLLKIGRFWLIHDLALVFHSLQHVQEQTSRLSDHAQQIGLKIARRRLIRWFQLNITNPSPIQLNGEYLPTTEEFTYLGFIVRHDGAGNISNRLNKARNAFRMLTSILRSQQYNSKTKLRLYHSRVVSTFLSVRLRMLANDSSNLNNSNYQSSAQRT